MANRTAKWNRTTVIRIAASVALYAMALAAVLLLGRWLDDEPEPQEVFGSLEGRFNSEISQEYQGKTVYYREREITNYLLIGADASGAAYQTGAQADFLLILSIDRRNRTITPVMIDRDTMAMVTTYGVFGDVSGERQMQICLAQAFSAAGKSGSDNTARAVSRLLGGVKIDHCLTMDMGGIARLNDALGGVTVTIEDDLTALDPALKKGATVRLQGAQAEHFVRGRMTVADGTNRSRMTRQKTYIEALVRSLEQELDGSIETMEAIYAELSGHIVSDTHETVIFADVNAYCDYTWQTLCTISGTHCVGEDGFTEFWPEKQALEALIVSLWFH